MPRRHLTGLSLAALAGLLGGCVVAYQPMSGLHRPVALDLGRANFSALRVDLRCLGPGLSRGEAGSLCQRVARLFENQGATVRTRTDRGRFEAEGAEAAPPPALTIELVGRRVHEEKSSVLWLWSYVSDYTVAQDVVVRDETGFLLARETLTGRFQYRLGFTSDTDRRFSEDFYGQLSQIAFNAKIRRRVLAESTGAAPKPAAKPAPEPKPAKAKLRGVSGTVEVDEGVEAGVEGGVIGGVISAEPTPPPSFEATVDFEAPPGQPVEPDK